MVKPSNERILAALDRLVVAAVGITTIALAESGANEDLSLAQWRTLALIAGPAALRSSDVALRIGVSRPSMSRIVRRLRQRGIIELVPDPLDGRATILRATPAGVTLRATTIGRRRDLMARALEIRPDALPEDLASGVGAIAEALEGFA